MVHSYWVLLTLLHRIFQWLPAVCQIKCLLFISTLSFSLHGGCISAKLMCSRTDSVLLYQHIVAGAVSSGVLFPADSSLCLWKFYLYWQAYFKAFFWEALPNAPNQRQTFALLWPLVPNALTPIPLSNYCPSCLQLPLSSSKTVKFLTCSSAKKEFILTKLKTYIKCLTVYFVF